MKILYKKIDDKGIFEKAHSADVGYDIASTEDTDIASGSVAIIRTGIIACPPRGYYLGIYSRSGLAAKHSVFVLNAPGVIDPGYCGDTDEIKVILYNLGPDIFSVRSGDRVAQAILCPLIESTACQVSDTYPLSLESRGGLGSTGRYPFREKDTENLQVLAEC